MMSPLLRDAEIRSLGAKPCPLTLNEDPPRDVMNRTVFVLYKTSKPVQQTLALNDLVATQKAFDAKRVHTLMQRPKSELANEPIKVVRMGERLYIVDGHHRAFAKAFNNSGTIRANVVMA